MTTTARASVPTRNSIGVAADRLAVGTSLVLDGPAGVGDVGLAGLAEALEPGARADAVDGDLAGEALILEALGHPLAEREDRRTAGGDDVAGQRQGVNLRQLDLARGRRLGGGGGGLGGNCRRRSRSVSHRHRTP